ncbi:hypothetical protein [Tunicatimonas pelagia]|uniref:hypothetical protein n=1 Tax=Tunicatimonas pelagia TaxID=931531 RepID=UPI002666D231|nr:hypothetical protein [Tunicatimonas pelagia]WKN42701.1 hypothetical protein P0M28_27055 [Tunicatimonas pelagia]
MKYILTPIVILSLIQSSVLAQSGWTRGEGETFIQTTVSTFSSNEFYALDGELFDQGNRFQSQALTLYGEYGITRRVTALLNAPLYRSNRFSNTERIGGVGDIRVGAKYAISQKLPISFSVEAEIPTGNGVNFASVTENPVVAGERINLPVTDGEFNIWSTLAISKSLPTGKTYGSLYGQYNVRTEGFTDQYRVGLELGQCFIDRVWLIGRLGIQESTSDGQAVSTFLYGEGTTYTTYGLIAMADLTKVVRLTASYSDYVGFIAEQQNIYGGAIWSLGVAWELNILE